MGDVFRGWRRKVGLSLLLVTLFVTMLWIRSLRQI